MMLFMHFIEHFGASDVFKISSESPFFVTYKQNYKLLKYNIITPTNLYPEIYTQQLTKERQFLF